MSNRCDGARRDVVRYLKTWLVTGVAGLMGSNRTGDIRHPQANADKAETLLNHECRITLEQGLAAAMAWYVRFGADHTRFGDNARGLAAAVRVAGR